MAARKPKYTATFTPKWQVDITIGAQKASFDMPVEAASEVRDLFINLAAWLQRQMTPPEEEETSAIIEAMKDPDAK